MQTDTIQITSELLVLISVRWTSSRVHGALWGLSRLSQQLPPRIKGSQLPIKDVSSKHLHIHHFLSISIFLETARKIDKVFDVRETPSTDRNRMKLKL